MHNATKSEGRARFLVNCKGSNLRSNGIKALALVLSLMCLIGLAAGAGQEVRVNLARGLSNATPDPALTNNSIVVSLPGGDNMYLGSGRVSKEKLGEQIQELKKQRTEAEQVVYIAGSSEVEYGKIVDILNLLRERYIDQFSLIVDGGDSTPNVRRTFAVMVPTQRDPGDDISKLKPNPLTLVAAIAPDLNLTLNRDSGPRRGQLCFSSVPHGVGNEPANLQIWLECLFDYRTKQRAFKIGMETRNDIPLEQRIEKIVFVKAPRSVKYGDVLRAINALQGAGANPIGLQVDDLPN